jgi:hypothetical protein
MREQQIAKLSPAKESDFESFQNVSKEPEMNENIKEECLGAAALDAPERRPRHSSSSSDSASSVEMEENVNESIITAEDLDISRLTKTSRPLPKDTFYFYQSADGQSIFLHALNVQMLVEEYGALENCPKVIKGKILEKDHTSMTEELRNKLRYLRHMPLSCNFEVCEIELKHPLVSPETIGKFKEQLDNRRKKRVKRAKEEKRRDKRIQIENNKLLGKYPEAKLRIESEYHFPDVNRSSFSSAFSPNPRRSSESDNSLLSTSPSSEVLNEGNQPSFARIFTFGDSREVYEFVALLLLLLLLLFFFFLGKSSNKSF